MADDQLSPFRNLWELSKLRSDITRSTNQAMILHIALTTFLVSIYAVGIHAGVNTVNCPTGYTNVNNVCLIASEVATNWVDAAVYCQAYRGVLVVVDSANMTNNVLSFISGIGDIGGSIWIGLNDQISNGNWFHYHRLADYNVYQNWNAGEPNGGNNENCIEAGTTDLSWNDANCLSNSRKFVCEYISGTEIL